MLYFVRSQPLPDQIFSTISVRTPHIRILPVTSTDFIHKNHPHFTRVSIRTSADLHVCILPWHWLQVRQDGTRKKNSYRSVSYNSPTYQIWFRLPIPNLNPKTDPNPNLKSNKNVCSTKQHRNNFQHRVISKSYFRWAGGGYTKGPPPEGGIKLLQK